MAGPDGEVALVGALSDVSQSHRTAIVAALGDAQGQAGPDALREVLADADASTDTRCAALLALAKRDGVEASTELAGHLNHRSKAVRSYAMRGLAVVGDDRAWADAMRLLRRLLERPTPIDVRFHAQLPRRPVATVAPADMPSLSAMFDAMVAITYLVRHLADPTAPDAACLSVSSAPGSTACIDPSRRSGSGTGPDASPAAPTRDTWKARTGSVSRVG